MFLSQAVFDTKSLAQIRRDFAEKNALLHRQIIPVRVCEIIGDLKFLFPNLQA